MGFETSSWLLSTKIGLFFFVIRLFSEAEFNLRSLSTNIFFGAIKFLSNESKNCSRDNFWHAVITEKEEKIKLNKRAKKGPWPRNCDKHEHLITQSHLSNDNKGQLISKGHFSVFNSSKKRTWKIFAPAY